MKYIVVLGDGMADEPIPELGNRTPLDAAVTPVMDELASKGCHGAECARRNGSRKRCRQSVRAGP